MNERITDAPGTRKEKRRSSRFPVVVPVEATWQDDAGQTIRAQAQVKEVNAEGGLLEMTTYPGVGRQIVLTNLLSRQEKGARVLAIRRAQSGAIRGVAVELLAPDPTFWGVNFQLRKTSDDLVKIEQAIKSGGVEPRILREFRDAVDYVRKTAWAVQEWQERQLQKHDPQTVLPLLTTERIRRATQLSEAIIKDLTLHEVTRETIGIDEFFQSIETLHGRVADLLKNRES